MLHARADDQHLQDPSGKIPQDEPVFLLRAQDATAAEAVRYWAGLQQDDGLKLLALRHAAKMEAWPKKKVADGPAVAREVGTSAEHPAGPSAGRLPKPPASCLDVLEEAENAARGASLPADYQWGVDALECFRTGTERAAEAIAALREKVAAWGAESREKVTAWGAESSPSPATEDPSFATRHAAACLVFALWAKRKQAARSEPLWTPCSEEERLRRELATAKQKLDAFEDRKATFLALDHLLPKWVHLDVSDLLPEAKLYAFIHPSPHAWRAWLVENGVHPKAAELFVIEQFPGASVGRK